MRHEDEQFLHGVSTTLVYLPCLEVETKCHFVSIYTKTVSVVQKEQNGLLEVVSWVFYA